MVHVRAATIADLDTIVGFNQAMARETEDKRLALDVLSAGVRNLLENPGHGFYLVAEIGAEVAGCLMITPEWTDWRNGRFWWVQSVYVKAEFRRRGVYRALYAHVKALAAREGDVRGFRLYVEIENDTAQETYRKLGMHEARYRMFEEPC